MIDVIASREPLEMPDVTRSRARAWIGSRWFNARHASPSPNSPGGPRLEPAMLDLVVRAVLSMALFLEKPMQARGLAPPRPSRGIRR